jgi:hypothetical protein
MSRHKIVVLALCILTSIATTAMGKTLFYKSANWYFPAISGPNVRDINYNIVSFGSVFYTEDLSTGFLRAVAQGKNYPGTKTVQNLNVIYFMYRPSTKTYTINQASQTVVSTSGRILAHAITN